MSIIFETKKNKKRNRILKKIFICLSSIVVFVTTYMLILPAITMEIKPICGYEEHIHIKECYKEDHLLICQEEHDHDETCYKKEITLRCLQEEHVHDDDCYPKADEESKEDWEKTFAKVDLTKNWSKDVISIAKTQIGYQESQANTITLEDGRIQGYSRYGQWANQPYEAWSSLFVSFCLDYANVNMPFDEDMDALKELLKSDVYDIYYSNKEYKPRSGDLIFIDENQDHQIDYLGFVESYDYETKTIKTIIGDYDDQVKRIYYDLDDKDIAGFGKLSINPEQLSKEEIYAVEKIIDLIDQLPDYQDVNKTLISLEDNLEEYEIYYSTIEKQVSDVYQQYILLTDKQKEYVANQELLLAYTDLFSISTLTEIKSDSPTIAKSATTSDFIDLNLYDYGSNINEKYKSSNEYPGFQWNGGAYMYTSKFNRKVIDYMDFGNSLITDIEYGSTDYDDRRRSPNSSIVANKGGTINELDVSDTYGVTNRPIGISTGVQAIKNQLSQDGYPILKENDVQLDYLFSNNKYATKLNTSSIDGLFQYDEETGAYYFNSRENHAQYSDNKFTLYNQIITPNFITYPFGNFLPLNDITDSSKATQVSQIKSIGNYTSNIRNRLSKINSASEKQLYAMLGKYETSLKGISTKNGKTAYDTWNAKDAINDYFIGPGDHPSDDTSLITNDLLKKMYNIDWNVDTNFFFGMDMHMKFMQSKGGLTGKNNQTPMKFYFTGDDDVWIYIDGVLFIDLSGIHRHVGGDIDFVNGKVNYYYLDTANTGDVSTKPYKTYTFRELFELAGIEKSEIDNKLNDKGTFKDYSTHDFKFFYMERGSGSSVCRMNFNFPLLKKNSMSVNKTVENDENTLGNPDYYFQIYDKDNNVFSINKTYKVYDQGHQLLDTRVADENGIFYIKADQTAVFEDVINENQGNFYVKELLDKNTWLDGDGQFSEITVNGSTTEVNKVTGTLVETFEGATSPPKDASNEYLFNFINTINTERLGQLKLTKVLTKDSYQTNKEFVFLVKINDGELLPKGTKYTLIDKDGHQSQKSVDIAGEIKLKANESVIIDHLLAGTKYQIMETNESSEGYIVKYKDLNTGEEIVQDESWIQGMIQFGKEIGIEVENREAQGFLELPIYKTLPLFDHKDRTFTFVIDEVDQDGQVIEDGFHASTSLLYKEDQKKALLQIPYLFTQVNEGQTLYYRIYEKDENDKNVVYDQSYYMIEVNITKSNKNKTVNPTIVRCVKYNQDYQMIESDKLVFDNLIVGDLQILKELNGSSLNHDSFEMIVCLKENDNIISGVYQATIYKDDLNLEKTMIEFDDQGEAIISLKQGERVIIHDLPYQVSWIVKEKTGEDFGYDVMYKNGDVISDKDYSYGSIDSTDNIVTVVNNEKYRLPETGGRGTILYMIGGITLMITTLSLYLVLKRRYFKGKER